MPCLREVNAVIKSSRQVVKSKRDFKEQVSMAIKGVLHENADVKKYALKELGQLLSQHQVSVLLSVAFQGL